MAETPAKPLNARTGPNTLELTAIAVVFLVPGLLAPQPVLLAVGIVVLVGAVVRAGLTLWRAQQAPTQH